MVKTEKSLSLIRLTTFASLNVKSLNAEAILNKLIEVAELINLDKTKMIYVYKFAVKIKCFDGNKVQK